MTHWFDEAMSLIEIDTPIMDVKDANGAPPYGAPCGLHPPFPVKWGGILGVCENDLDFLR